MMAFLKKLGIKRLNGRSRKTGVVVAPDPVCDSDTSDEGSEDDAVGELPQLVAINYQNRKQRQSVSAEAYGEWNKRADFIPPVYPKNESQKSRIKAAVFNGFLFNSLEPTDLSTVIDAFVETKVPAGDIIIAQGDEGECLYLIEEGELDVFKVMSGETEPRHLCVMSVGDTVGELALLYSCARAATVKAKVDSCLWSLDRRSFNHIVKDAAFRIRQRHEDFLSEVELLKDMDPYERSKLADALKMCEHAAGQNVLTEGETGDTFYIIESGEAEALKNDTVVLSYTRGNYFGELALIRDAPRAATVRAKTDLTCVYLDRRSFQRLLGPIEGILRRNAVRYEKVQSMMSSAIITSSSELRKNVDVAVPCPKPTVANSDQPKEETPTTAEDKKQTPTTAEDKKQTPTTAENKKETPTTAENKKETPTTAEDKKQTPTTAENKKDVSADGITIKLDKPEDNEPAKENVVEGITEAQTQSPTITEEVTQGKPQTPTESPKGGPNEMTEVPVTPTESPKGGPNEMTEVPVTPTESPKGGPNEMTEVPVTPTESPKGGPNEMTEVPVTTKDEEAM